MPDFINAIDMTSLYEVHPSLAIVEKSVESRLLQRKDIVSLLPKGAVGAEIGVFTGILSEFLLNLTEPSKFYMVDPWHRLYGRTFPSWGAYTDQGRLTTAEALAAARYRASKFPAAEIVVSTSLEWLSQLPDKHLDWVYLDSSHKYEDTMRELLALSTKVTDEGLIFGDDAWTERGNAHYGVFQVITDFCRIRPFELFRLDHAAQWALRRQPSF
jgi:hypothetical protein